MQDNERSIVHCNTEDQASSRGAYPTLASQTLGIPWPAANVLACTGIPQTTTATRVSFLNCTTRASVGKEGLQFSGPALCFDGEEAMIAALEKD